MTGRPLLSHVFQWLSTSLNDLVRQISAGSFASSVSLATMFVRARDPVLLSLLCAVALVSPQRSQAQHTMVDRRVPGVELLQPTCERSGPYPYVVSVRGQDGEHRCGGVLVTSTAVLTSASCVDPRAGLQNVATRPQLYLGGAGRDAPVEIRTTCNVFFPPEWTGDRSSGTDIALILFGEDTCIPPVPSIGADPTREMRFMIGYGRSGENQPFNERKTVSSGMVVTDAATCTAAYGVEVRMNEKCTRSTECDCAAACEGDEGSPLITIDAFGEFTDQVEGIISRTHGACDETESVALFTELAPLRSWIDLTISSATCSR